MRHRSAARKAASSSVSQNLATFQKAVRDSDPTESQFGFPLYNWAVHFEIAVSK